MEGCDLKSIVKCHPYAYFFLGMPDAPVVAEVTSFAVAVLLIGAGIRYRMLISTVLGVFSAFLGLVVGILRHIDDPTLAAVALIAVGLGLLAAIVVKGRSRPWRGVVPAKSI